MKKARLFAAILIGIGLTAVLFTACKDEEESPVPDASFSFTASGNGLTVQFTNESENADSYDWNFGDGNTSTDVNPVHTYPDYGQYTVVLSASGPGGTDEFSYNLTVTKASTVKLDDNSFDDWATIPVTFQSVDNSGGLINKVKVDYDGENIYFYMEVKDNLTDSLPTGIHFDIDNDTTTGFNPWTNTAIGSDFYVEAAITTAGWASAFMFDKDAASQNDWAWIDKSLADFIINGYHTQNGEMVYVEWGIVKSKMDAITTNGNVVLGNKVTMIINHYYNWEPAGFFPGNGEPAFVLEMQ